MHARGQQTTRNAPAAEPMNIRASTHTGFFGSPEQGHQLSMKSGDAGPTTPAAHHLIFAPAENASVSSGAADGRILSASELLPLPTTGSQPDGKRGQVREACMLQRCLTSLSSLLTFLRSRTSETEDRRAADCVTLQNS